MNALKDELKTKQKVVTLVDTLRHLKINEEMVFPVSRLISVRGTISRLKNILGLRFTCIVNEKRNEDDEEEVKTFTVKRRK